MKELLSINVKLENNIIKQYKKILIDEDKTITDDISEHIENKAGISKEIEKRKCLFCKTEFERKMESDYHWNKKRFCSIDCREEHRKKKE